MRATFLLPALALSALSVAAAVTTGKGLPATTHVTVEGKTSAAWMLCDGLNSPQAIAVGTPDASGRAVLTTFSKSRPGEYSYLAYIVGDADPGAGNVYYPLSPRDGSGSGDGSRYNLHTFSAGALSDPGRAYTPTLTSVTLNGATTQCRWVQGTRFLGVTERRSVLVTEADDGTLTYQTYDFSGFPQATLDRSPDHTSAPSLTVRGGGLAVSGSDAVYTFANNGYTYTLRAGNGGASLSVSQNGKLLQTETFSAYQTGRRSAR